MNHSDSQQKKIVTRIAPSPTGALHIGTARTALFNYLLAKKHKGTFILRFEDTDKERSRDEHKDNIRDALRWLSLKPDQVVHQSSRTSIYAQHIQQLVDADKAYISKESSKKDPSQQVSIVRFRNTNPHITFTDTVRGDITTDISNLGDFVIARSLNDPLYHLAVVIDDMKSGVTHILRGDDHIINTPPQIALIKALGGDLPSYTHIPLIHSASGGKLSKRKGATAVTAFRDRGYAPEAVLNAIALLGWSPKHDNEVFTLKELISEFSLDGVQRKEAIFNEKKLQWFHKQHVRKIPENQLRKEIVPAIVKRFPFRSRLHPKSVKAVLHDTRERGVLFKEARESITAGGIDFLFVSPEYKQELLIPKKVETEKKSISNILEKLKETKRLLEEIGTHTQWNEEFIEKQIAQHAESSGKSITLWPLRVALSGKEKSPGPFFIAGVIGKKQTLKRVEKACTALKGILSRI